MSGNFVYNRVLLKLSGETLKGKFDHGYDAEAVRNVVARIKPLVDQGLEIAIVVGAGNIWRGVMGANTGMDPVTCDYMGMLGTMMNGLCLKEFCCNGGIDAEVYGSTPFSTAIKPFDRASAMRDLAAGKVVIFAGGTGSPFFTTDTTAALRALETQCDAVLKATKVDGIYTADPFKDPNAVRFKVLTYEEALSRQLKVMDAAAFSLCREHDLPIVVFNFFEAGSLDSLDINERQCKNSINMLVIVRLVKTVFTECLNISIVELLGSSNAQNLLPLGCIEELTLLVKELEGIPLTWVVARCEDDTATSVFHCNSNFCCRS